MSQYPKSGQSELRKHRRSASGAEYFITFTVADRAFVLTDDAITKIIIDEFLNLEKVGFIKTSCCMIMPDHVHVVFELAGNSLDSFMRRFKSATARKINQHLQREGAFWGKQFFEHQIRENESRVKIVRYCYENPLRKGLVERSKDWPFWWCAWEME